MIESRVGFRNDELEASQEYTVRRVALSNCDPRCLAEWQEFLERRQSSIPQHDPLWLMTHFADRRDKVSVYLLYKSGSICGVAPFAYDDWPLEWHLGELRVAKIPLRRLFAVGGVPDFPDDESAWNLLFGELASSGGSADALYLDCISLESFLWKYICQNAAIRSTFRPYLSQPPAQHYMIYLGSTFDAYMDHVRKFSVKHRNALSRKVRRIREGELGTMQFNRYMTPDEVPSFVELAHTVSRKTWQFNLLGRGVADGSARRRLAIEAENGWLRSYVLLCGGRPVAYIVGFQYGDRFVYHEIGSDPEFSNKYSLGTVILMLTIEDLFGYRRAHVMDLGRGGQYKEAFTKDSVLEGTIFLFYPGAYAGFVRKGHKICQTISIGGSRLLERLDLKETLRRAIRKVSTRS